MPAAITSDALLSRIKARAQVPTTEGRLSDVEIFALCDDLILTNVGRAVYDADDGRWAKTAADVTIMSGTATYRIPTRSWAGGVDDAQLVNSAGDTWQLEYVDRSDAYSWGTQTGVPCAFTIVGDVITLLPTPTSGYSLRLRYLRRPSRLVSVASCAPITAVAATVLTASTASAVINSVPVWSSPMSLDVVNASDHGESVEDDIAVTFTASDITRSSGSFATSGAFSLVAGSVQAGTVLGYACFVGAACVVQVPDVAIPYVADLAARDVCVALGDMEGADRSAALAEQRRKDMEQSIAERSRLRPKIVPRNSPLRVAQQRAAWWRR